MAVAYARVFMDVGVDFTAVGRGQASASAFTDATGQPAATGGLTAYLEHAPHPLPPAIVAVGVEDLAACTRKLVEAGCPAILTEKPAGLDPAEVRALAKDVHPTPVYVAYNRRFYNAVLDARQRIAADGGATSLLFEFTEWSHKIGPLPKSAAVKANWLFANSSHVIDMAFHLAGGYPESLTASVAGRLDWHPPGSIFTGAGVTTSQVPFAYHANWTGPGRWWVEVCTAHNRYIFRPLEALQVQRLGTITTENVPLPDDDDTAFKPGLKKQVTAFLNHHSDASLSGALLSLGQFAQVLGCYESIARGT